MQLPHVCTLTKLSKIKERKDLKVTQQCEMVTFGQKDSLITRNHFDDSRLEVVSTRSRILDFKNEVSDQLTTVQQLNSISHIDLRNRRHRQE